VPLAAYLAYARFGHEVQQGLIHLAAAAIVVTAVSVRAIARLPDQQTLVSKQ
jgi:hypothetical protein